MRTILKTYVCLIFLVGCASKEIAPIKETVKKPKPGFQQPLLVGKNTYRKFTGKFEDRPLAIEGDWIGGSSENPVFYTSEGERIYTLDKDVFVYPVTIRSVDKSGRVIYPDEGFQLIGDMSVVHFSSLIHALAKLRLNKSLLPLRIEGDSNFLERPVIVSSLKSKEVIGSFKFSNNSWVKLNNER